MKKDIQIKNLWLSDDLKMKIRTVFQQKYKKELTDEEIIGIADNLTYFMETYFTFKLKQNENQTNLS